MKKGIRILLWTPSIILIIFGVLNFFGVLDFYNQITVQSPGIQELGNTILYSNVIYQSTGAFIQNKPISFSIELNLFNESFPNGNYSAQFMSDNCHLVKYPLQYGNVGAGENNILTGEVIDLKLTNENHRLVGSGKMLFFKYGDCNELVYIYLNGLGKPPIFMLNKRNMQISPIETWLTIKSNRFILSLTIITIALTFIQILLQESRRNKRKETIYTGTYKI